MSSKTTALRFGPDDTSASHATEVLRDRDQAEAYVASVCFKHGPPRLVGVELEWLLSRSPGCAAPLDAKALVAALGPHTPHTLDPRSPALPLPAGSLVTVEPGGQVELASSPFPNIESLFDAVESDSGMLHTRLRQHGLHPSPYASDPAGPPRRLLTVPRYSAMEAAFDRIGPHGRSMMCSTAAVQPCFDLGERTDLWQRWTVLHAVGPVLLAAFANSPVLHGQRTGWKSSRMACWWALDPPRTVPPDLSVDDPAISYARRVMEAELLCLRRAGASWDAPTGVTFADWLDGALPSPPTTADLDLHLSTLFPPVRPQGHFEVRYLDAQPGQQWVVPAVVLAAVLSTPTVSAAVLESCLPVADRWVAAARIGLADPELAKAAVAVFTLAVEALPAVIGFGPVHDLVERFVQGWVMRGRCPADDAVEPFVADQPGART
ncbi:MAG: ergothioneine biosynthesis glutamate--cysteine ligase EgtA [Pseudonocardia sp.]|nr:ergothioneine biosynthesis glutamate--cysteine ligase EgtA [Pseudonocardia sp.]